MNEREKIRKKINGKKIVNKMNEGNEMKKRREIRKESVSGTERMDEETGGKKKELRAEYHE